MKEKPMVTLVFTLTVSVLIFGCAVQVFERGVQTELDKFEFLWNSMWLIILSMTTGDY